MNNTADDYSSRKISNTPSKKGVFEMNSNSNSNSNELLNVNPSALALSHPPKKSGRAIKCLTIAACVHAKEKLTI